jgi:hypothetical protein
MVGAGADDAHADPVLLIPAGETVDDVDAVAGVEVVDSTLAVDLPDLQGKKVSMLLLMLLMLLLLLLMLLMLLMLPLMLPLPLLLLASFPKRWLLETNAMHCTALHCTVLQGRQADSKPNQSLPQPCPAAGSRGQA